MADTSTALEILKAYESLILNDANEAETRLKVINRTLREVLGWLDEDISVEEHVSEDGTSKFADYILRTANAAIVIEAKKVGSAFASAGGSRRVKLTKNFLQTELGSAILQARDYARKLSIDFAIATNGAVWAVFPAQRHDQVLFQDSTALIFWSLKDALNENYQEFHDLVSRDSVISGGLEHSLLGKRVNQHESRKLRVFFSSNSRASLINPMFPLIESEVMTAFSDSIVELNDETFEHCYVATPESMKFDSRIRMYVNRREQIVGGKVLRPMKKLDADQLVSRVKASAANNRRSLAMLLLGTVGAGKTTFLHYIRNIRLKDVFKKNSTGDYPHWLHLDFLNNSPNTSVTDFIYRSLRDYINTDAFLSDNEKCTTPAYADEIHALRMGPLAALANSEEKFGERIADLIFKEYQEINPYVERIIKFATKHTTFFLVIDNVDQLEDDAIQSKLVTESLAIARGLGLNLVLVLRQSTFVKHRNSPAIDAFDWETVQIDPPRIPSVLSKRFALVKLLASKKKGEFVAENGVKVHVNDAAQIVELLQGSVLGTDIGTRIEVLATEDVRLALRMTRGFLERGYTNPGYAMKFHQETGEFILPRHEAFRAIILGTRTVYDEDFSAIGNPFDSKISVNQAQLLRLFVLSAIVSYATDSGFRFVDGSTISENLRKIGFGDSFTSTILSDLCKHRFLFTANHGEPTIASSFVPSRLGGYIIRDLLADFTFLENMMFDTYIADATIWQQLKELSSKLDSQRDRVERIRLRINRLRLFYDYMHKCLGPLILESQKRGLPSEWSNDIMAEREQDFKQNLDKVLKSATKNYGPDGRHSGSGQTTASPLDESRGIDEISP